MGRIKKKLADIIIGGLRRAEQSSLAVETPACQSADNPAACVFDKPPAVSGDDDSCLVPIPNAVTELPEEVLSTFCKPLAQLAQIPTGTRHRFGC